MKQLRHGQITIPKDMREALGLQQDDLLSVELSNGKLEIEPVRVARKGVSSQWLLELYELFAPVRGSLESYSEEEINEAIDDALEAARRDRKR
ncbi:MAG TPA: AbrB/MazE/SpoVT family DNA-binding domain-containing protein [Dehalococcoidia bacterium]|nr:AbrB/MazE/SpoVT family DNA-binding domain-containing protein [Dehalococcoidia bacterium]